MINHKAAVGKTLRRVSVYWSNARLFRLGESCGAVWDSKRWAVILRFMTDRAAGSAKRSH